MKTFLMKPWSISMDVKLAVLILSLFISMSSFGQGDAKGPVRSLGAIQDNDTKGQVNSMFGNVATLGNQWQVTECCGWSGTWTRRANTNTFDAKWKHTNGTSAADVIELMTWNRTTNEVVLYRKTMNGSYKALYNPTNKTLSNGTTTWYPAGQYWSAIIR